MRTGPASSPRWPCLASGVRGAGRAGVCVLPPCPPAGEAEPVGTPQCCPLALCFSPSRGSEEEEQAQPETGCSNGRGECFLLGLVSLHVTLALGLTGIESVSVLDVLPVLCIDWNPLSLYLFPPTFPLGVSW